jgi:HEAT repeat protein
MAAARNLLVALLAAARIQSAMASFSPGDDGDSQARTALNREVSALIKKLEHGSREVRWSAMVSLIDLGPAGADAVPAIVNLLKDRDWMTRQLAAGTLAFMGAEASRAAPALVEALHDEQVEVSLTAGFALSRIGPPAIPLLVKALTDEDYIVRQAAASALGRMGPKAQTGLPALRQALKDKSPPVRERATEAIERIER